MEEGEVGWWWVGRTEAGRVEGGGEREEKKGKATLRNANELEAEGGRQGEGWQREASAPVSCNFGLVVPDARGRVRRGCPGWRCRVSSPVFSAADYNPRGRGARHPEATLRGVMPICVTD
jgi:hypothetical protein